MISADGKGIQIKHGFHLNSFCDVLAINILSLTIMNRYTNTEMTDMHFIYGLADGNSLKARRLYIERFPGRNIPDRKLFQNIHQRLHETGALKKMGGPGKPNTVRTVELEENVLDMIEEDPSTSTRKISNTLNVSNKTVWKILKDNLLYPYHMQRVQALIPTDFPPRIAFCQWLLTTLVQIPQLLTLILFTDEANFSRNAIRNFHNNHVWADENPHEVIEDRFQHQFSLNVWVGIVGDCLIGPIFLPERLTGDVYRNFLEQTLPLFLEDVPLAIRHAMWFMHDGAPAHFSLVAREFLTLTYGDRWIGRGGPHLWPARSPDLNPLDYFLWGHLKSLVYTTPVENVEDLRNRIIAGCNLIRNDPGVFERVRQSMRRRLDACMLARGGHFQQFL